MPSSKNSAPDIQVSAVSLDFADVKSGGTKTKKFEIRNLGGEAPDVRVKWDNKPSWAEFSLDRTAQAAFPIIVTVTVTAHANMPDDSYNANLIVYQDGNACAGVTAFMTVVGSSAKLVPLRQSAPIAARPQPTSRPAMVAGGIGIAGILMIGFFVFLFIVAAIANNGGFAPATEVPYVPPTDIVYVDPYADILNEVFNQFQMKDHSTVYCADESDPCRLYATVETTLYNKSGYDITLHSDTGCNVYGSSDTAYDWYMDAGSSADVICPIVYNRSDDYYSVIFRIVYPQYGPDQSGLDMVFTFTVE